MSVKKIQLEVQKRKRTNDIAYTRSQYYLRYTVIFSITFILVYLQFFLNGKSNIWDGDSILQSYPNLIYLREWVKEIIQNFFQNGEIEIPMWDMNIGFGQDFLNVIAFRPVNFLSLLFPSSCLEVYYWVRHIIFLYFGGISFSAFLYKIKGKRDISVLLGSLIFVFGGFSLAYMTKHAIFAEELLYLPLFMLGVEKIFRKEKPYVFVLATAFCGMSYFYNLYSITLIGVIYAVLRLYKQYNKIPIKIFFSTLARFSIWYFCGLGLAAFSFLPNFILAMSSGRGGENSYGLLYSANYYWDLISGILGKNQIGIYGYIGVPALAFLTVAILFIVRKNSEKILRISLILLLVMLCFPFFGKLFNGFAGVSNRWTFVIPFVIGVVFALKLKDIFNLEKKDIKKLCIVVCIYAVGLLVADVLSLAEVPWRNIIILLSTMMIILLYYIFPSKKIIIATLVLMFIEIGIQGFQFYSPKEGSFIYEFADQGKVTERIWDNCIGVMQEVTQTDSEVFRTDSISEYYDDKLRDSNYGLRTLQNGLSTYYSYTDSHIVEANQLLGNGQVLSPFRIFDFDQRTVLNTLGTVKYVVAPEGRAAYVPYGYEWVDNIDGVEIYKNKYFLPLMYSYDNTIAYDDYLKLKPYEKEWAMLQGIVIEDYEDNTNSITPQFNYSILKNKSDLNSTIEYWWDQEDESSPVKILENGILVQGGASITLDVNVPANTELYVSYKNIKFKGLTGKELTDYYLQGVNSKIERNDIKTTYNSADTATVAYMQIASGDVTKQVDLVGVGNQYYFGQRDLVVNLGYAETERSQVTLSFPNSGYYTFDDFEIIAQPMDVYSGQIEKIKENSATNIEISGNNITGNIYSEKGGFLCVAVPYAKGWTAQINGKEADVYPANNMYMSVKLEPGENNIHFSYRTAGFYEGILVTIVVVVIILITIIIKNIKKLICDSTRRKHE